MDLHESLRVYVFAKQHLMQVLYEANSSQLVMFLHCEGDLCLKFVWGMHTYCSVVVGHKIDLTCNPAF